MSKPRPESVTLQAGQDLGAFPLVPIAAAWGAAAVGVVSWIGLFFGGLHWLAPLGVGTLVGLAVMFTDKHGDKRLPWAAAGVTLLTCWVAYFIMDHFLITWIGAPRTIAQSILAFPRNMSLALMSLVGAYLAWVVASRAGKPTTEGLT
ncbi:MAG: hypothetical protein AAGI54_05230 [Planctomycetota bacterium]